MMKKMLVRGIASAVLAVSMQAACASAIITMYLTDAKGHGKSIGTIKAEDGICGVLLTPKLQDLPPGIHGFHIHTNPDCGDLGMNAGDHFDPESTDKHRGPYDHSGHLGDLPVLIVNQDGRATIPTLAPRFKVSDMKKHALIIHADGDTYADVPQKNGGGGYRIACGVIY